MLDEAKRLLEARDLAAARRTFDEAEAAGADLDACAWGRWMVEMLDGDFAAAWRESDWLRARQSVDPHRFWDGAPVAGKKVIVRCLHGFGDAVQMFRYARSLKRIAERVVWEVAPRLVPLAWCADGVEMVITWGEEAPAVSPAWESQMEVMELPYLFRSTAGTLPRAVPYLTVPEAEVLRVRGAMGETAKRRVGVAWSGGDWDTGRAVPREMLGDLLGVEGVEFWSLQREERAGEGMRDATEICGDGLLALAATMANLDLVITVDTLAAHLAGAMAKPVWAMLQRKADWRWMAASETSPWYPTMRLFRQTVSGPENASPWKSVLREVREALVKWKV